MPFLRLDAGFMGDLRWHAPAIEGSRRPRCACSGSIPLASAARAATLFVSTEAITPNPIVKAPRMQSPLGARIRFQLRLDVPIEAASDVSQIAELR